MRVINKTGRQVDVQGIDNHQIVDIAAGTVAGVIPTQKETSLPSCINMHSHVKAKLSIWQGNWSVTNMMTTKIYKSWQVAIYQTSTVR